MSNSTFDTDLPIHAVLPEIASGLLNDDTLLLEAPPGAGKTTAVPLALLDEAWLGGQKMLLLEPRRLAAKAAAERLAQNLGENVGETVGYRIRLESKVGPTTRIEVITEGILSRMLQDDPSLEGVGLVIFDEFHERSLDADIGLALSLQGRELFSDLREQPLKLLIMSATLEGDRLSALLGGAPVIRSEGRAYPVDIRYGDPYRFEQRLDQRVVQTVMEALQIEAGSVLVFLPGVGEIRRVSEQLNEQLQGQALTATVQVAPLYGDLSLAQQRAAIAPTADGQRKVVLATSIAESSLTIDGVRVVIDSGLSRVPSYDPATGLTRLKTGRLSKASAEQRAGRAGRTQAGVCYRLWSRQQQDELAAYPAPEIANADLMPLALQLLAWGCHNPQELLWLDPPSFSAFQQALQTLQQLGAVEFDHQQPQLTALGQQLSSLPAHPRLAVMMMQGVKLGCAELACQVAAILSERDLMASQGVDLSLRLDLMRGDIQVHSGQRGALERLRQQARQFKRLLPAEKAEGASIAAPSNALGLLLAAAYPDRIALQRERSGLVYQMANGRSVELPHGDGLAKCSAVVIAAAGGQQGRRQDRVFLAAELDMAQFVELNPEQLQTRIVVEWDERQEKLLAQEQVQLGRLVLRHKPILHLSPETQAQALMDLVRRKGLSLFEWGDPVQQWRARVQLMRQLWVDKGGVGAFTGTSSGVQNPWPDVSDNGLLQALEHWLAPYLQGVSKLGHLQRLDLLSMLKALLPWSLQQQLEDHLPLHIVVPSGSRIEVDYTQTPPVLAVKLQEMFGCVDTPTVAQGQVSLQLHLLSPARRPLQVTQDLNGFWKGSYEHVKKEMKGRYPKHPWPDDPLQALPTAKTKRHLRH